MPPKPEQTELQPGADRFWGQFSQSKAGRSAGDETETGEESRRGAAGESGAMGSEHCLEWCPICRSAELFRNTVSPELRQQADSIQHEAMGVLKAFLDAYADKAAAPGPAASTNGTSATPEEPEEPAGPRVTDIPLD